MPRLLSLFLLAGVGFIPLLSQSTSPKPDRVAGAAECKSCHEDIHQRWSDSIHGKMIQSATPATVLARATESLGKLPGSATWMNGRLFIEENGVRNRVDYTLGNRRIQHYITTKSSGQMFVLHASWDVLRQEWFHSREIVPGAPEGFVQQWNTSCVYCHVTQQYQDVKGFDAKTMTYKTSWVESSASCERCHGPLKDHAQSMKDRVSRQSVMPQTIRASKTEPPSLESMKVCAQCHWAKTVVATGFTTREPYFDHYYPSLIHFDHDSADPAWWADGRPKRFSNEAAAFFLSGCFQSGKESCTNCHDPHWNRTDGNDALMSRADQFCQKCHEGKGPDHTHHLATSPGSSCVACHMPYTVSGVKSKMRDHSMLVPDPQNTIRFDIPNACESCHDDHSPDWVVDAFEEWYPTRSPRLQQRALAFTLARKTDPRSVLPLIALARNTKENPAIRASAAGYLMMFPEPRSADALIGLATDSETLVRIETARSLGAMKDPRVISVLGRLVSDEARAVRVTAAESLVGLTLEDPSAVRAIAGVDRALAEYRDSLNVEADHAKVQVRLGALELMFRDVAKAREAYETALRLDKGEADAHIGLALLEEHDGRRSKAMEHARKAIEIADKPQYRELLKRLDQNPR